MRPRRSSRAPRRRTARVRKFKGMLLRRIGPVRLVVETERGSVLGWVTSVAQGQQLINWLLKGG
jgi:hypothetical protein